MSYRMLRGLPLLVTLAACSSARHKVDGDVVRNVTFQGNGDVLTRPLSGQTDYQLRSQLSVHQAPFGAFTFPLSLLADLQPFHPDELRADAYRLEVWYANHGWFDARVEGWDIRRVRPQRKRKAGVVDISGILDPGERSSVRTFDIEGMSTSTMLYGATVKKNGYVAEGDDYVLQYVFDTRDLLVDKLRGEAARAYATVKVDVQAYPKDHQVDVKLIVDEGPACKLGAITVTGNETVDLDVILDDADLSTGDSYSVEQLRDAQRRLFDTGLFSVVTVTPDLSDPTRKDVPIEVHVAESLFRTLRYGGGFDWDGQSLAPRLSASLRHMNAFHSLWRFELKGDFGFTSRPQGTRALVAGAEANLSRPRLFGSNKFGFVSKVGIRRDLLNQQFTYVNPYADGTFSWRISDSVVATIGPHVEQFAFVPFEGPVRLAASTLFGEGVQNPYSLATIDAGMVWDHREGGDPFSPSRGWFATGRIRQALPFANGGGFLYTEVEAERRQFYSIPQPDKSAVLRVMAPEVVALRGRLEWLIREDRDRPLPYPELAFLGGATDLRGFRQNQVGPYTCICTYEGAARQRGIDPYIEATQDWVTTLFGGDPPEREEVTPGDPFTGVPGAGQQVTQSYLPEGAPFASLVSVETRYSGLGGLPIDGVAFLDAGAQVRRIEELRDPRQIPRLLRLGYGLGLRYTSPVGPIRLDFAFRPLYPEDWGPKPPYIGCRIDDQVPRGFDVLSTPMGRRDLAERNTPFAFNLFFGIGQAF